MKIKELLDSSQKWTKEWFARLENGQICEATDENAVCYCLLGGLIKCYGDLDDSYSIEVKSKLNNAIDVLHPGFGKWHQFKLQFFNDDPKTTFDDIRKVLELADV